MTEVSTNTPEEKKNKYVLDEGVEEYIPFSVKGNNYLFRQPNTEELRELIALEGKSSEMFIDVTSKFVSKADESALEWEEMKKQLLAPHWVHFRDMILTEISGDNQS